MNKKYILLILNHIKKNFSYQPNKITIHKEPVKESITYEEWSTVPLIEDRKAKFHTSNFSWRIFTRSETKLDPLKSLCTLYRLKTKINIQLKYRK